jgi:choline-glycine betaine transporter
MSLQYKIVYEINPRSTVSGVGAGIRRISEVCFILGTFLMLMAFFLDDTFFLLNLVRKISAYSFFKDYSIKENRYAGQF